MKRRRFICYFYFVSWSSLSLGVSFDFCAPNLEIHLPFGFVRVGICSAPIMGTRFTFDRQNGFGVTEMWNPPTAYFA